MIRNIMWVIILSVSLSGCWSSKELTELAIVSALSIDKVDDGYSLTVQIINPGDIAGKSLTTRVAVSTYKAEGKSIFEAIRKLSKSSPRKLYFAHLRIVILGEELAKEGIRKSLELLSRDHEFRTDFYILVAKDHLASDIINVLTPVEKNPANKIFNTLEVSQSIWAPTSGVKLDELISKFTSKGNNPVLTGILVQGNEYQAGSLSNVESIPSPAVLELSNLAVLKKDKLIGWLNQEESKGYSYVTDKVKSTVTVIDYEDGYVTLEFTNSKTELIAEIINNVPKIRVTVEPEALIGEVSASTNFVTEEEIKKLEEKTNERGEFVLNSSIAKAKEYQSDIFGFGEAIRRKKPKLWKELESNWDEEGFQNLEVEIQFNTTIRRLGTTNQSFIEEIGE
ncbi:hypothetical protein Q75_06665 [Bacillus coahuilensis p1.1.43]|uniref:Uncharacterized protein n=1 Tax=Bacillus coahuilensis p1.1.43 TaxID=1150625 RepID=A0A147K9A1_9BACI|nr:Ger(x)C family spore germination protein [Bacillus coahuilensis]KUP06892.1 hypothetical protein Q75_06665 [Bacillus coahuilensis p1.1.43]